MNLPKSILKNNSGFSLAKIVLVFAVFVGFIVVGINQMKKKKNQSIDNSTILKNTSSTHEPQVASQAPSQISPQANSFDTFWKKSDNNTNDIFLEAGNVGIGTRALPQVKLEVAGTIRPAGANVGSACQPMGAMAFQENSGQPLYCDGGMWKLSNSTSGAVVTSSAPSGFSTTTVEGAVSPCQGTSIANCPEGYLVIGGGFFFQTGCACKEGADTPVITENRPAGNGWRVTMECAQNIAYAICLKQN